MQKLEDTSTPYTVGLAILGYSLCSSTLLLANKMAMVHLPSPSLVSFIQIFSSTITVLLLKHVVGVKIDDFDLTACKAYAIYTVAFVASIYTNMQALSSSNVETVIVFRACTPITVGIIEYFFMDRAWPSLRSSGSLVVVTTGAVIYCLSDSQFIVNGVAAYFWAIMYFVCITFEMTYGKNITSSVKVRFCMVYIKSNHKIFCLTSLQSRLYDER
jgi:solute carrier family 35 protein